QLCRGPGSPRRTRWPVGVLAGTSPSCLDSLVQSLLCCSLPVLSPVRVPPQATIELLHTHGCPSGRCPGRGRRRSGTPGPLATEQAPELRLPLVRAHGRHSDTTSAVREQCAPSAEREPVPPGCGPGLAPESYAPHLDTND